MCDRSETPVIIGPLPNAVRVVIRSRRPKEVISKTGEHTLDTLDRRISEIREANADGSIDTYEARDRLIALDRERLEVVAQHVAPIPDFVGRFVQLANEAAKALARVHYIDVHHDGIPSLKWHASCTSG